MRKSVALLCIAALALMSACQIAPQRPEPPPRAHVPAPHVAAQSNARAVAEAKPTPAPSCSPAPMIDAPWYRERNEQLRAMMQEFAPEKTLEQIEGDIQRMQIDPDQPMVALTFDDGPKPGVTDEILDVLEQYNARATFLVLGWRLDQKSNQNILRRAVVLGCEIGNHTWSHNRLPGQNFVSVRYEIENTNDAVVSITGAKPRCFRPPGGVYTYESLAVSRNNDMCVVLWSQSGNVHERDPKLIAQNVEKQIVDGDELEDGDIVLLHDTGRSMVDAVKIIVPALQAKGYQLVTVWELLNCANCPPVPGTLYDRR